MLWGEWLLQSPGREVKGKRARAAPGGGLRSYWAQLSNVEIKM